MKILLSILFFVVNLPIFAQSTISRDNSKDEDRRATTAVRYRNKVVTNYQGMSLDDIVDMGYNYFWGDNSIKQDKKKGLEMLQFAANKGKVEAYADLGDIYCDPESGLLDVKKAIYYYDKGIAKGSKSCVISMAFLYFDSEVIQPDYAKAKYYFDMEYNKSNGAAAFYIAQMYENGLGVEVDYKRAVQYYTESASWGWPQADVKLGQIYYSGNYTDKNYDKAFSYFSNVAYKWGMPDAWYGVALMKKDGLGCNRDVEGALDIFMRLKNNGYNVDEEIQNIQKILYEKNLQKTDVDTFQKDLHIPTDIIAEENQRPKIKVYKVNGIKFRMIYVEGGTFTMGYTSSFSKENPSHTVTLSSYYLAETEVTQKLWEEVMGYSIKNNYNRAKMNEPYSSLNGVGANNPMYYISWNECQLFIKRLNEKTGGHFRMPTEAEWEYAAIGGKIGQNTDFSGSDDAYEVGWFITTNKSGGVNFEKTHAVGKKKPNELGIYDMSGNIGEWCYDWMGDYPSNDMVNPCGPQNGTKRVWRGGYVGFFPPTKIKNRYSEFPDALKVEIGLRLAE